MFFERKRKSSVMAKMKKIKTNLEKSNLMMLMKIEFDDVFVLSKISYKIMIAKGIEFTVLLYQWTWIVDGMLNESKTNISIISNIKYPR
jgi:hypothetical protein